MCLTAFLITLTVAVVTHATKDVATASGLRFIGVGYNILRGNPDGGELSLGGVDPGLLSTSKILKQTWDTNKTSIDGRYRVPDQVLFVHRSSCVKFTTKEVFSGAKSYRDKLKVDVSASGELRRFMILIDWTSSIQTNLMQRRIFLCKDKDYISFSFIDCRNSDVPVVYP